ncbi:putative glutamine amidotransferase [Cyclonatronum proteinivorum]|uniref:Putative glutamine amidotransferase n=1 Tax=Cyclonatronum proteinivorum TaxID=1457365 RepID=A0A345UJH3_9BACT|nr:gamma-glutamyl-gamma-aminobutyrate hydrolase family protein [Cyclonatronum proteinivorum]AXJ00625.1 putative glutamine amidotransferase [Cyclonatronum proteinivorum]
MGRRKRSRPLIGVTGPDKGGLVAWVFTAIAVWRAGGWPKRIHPGMRGGLPEIEGLVIGGGADVSPELYGAEELQNLKDLSEEKTKRWTRFLFFFVSFGITLVRKLFSLGHTAGPDPARDALENKLLTEALVSDRPVLGICRGAQFINVHLGGTLYQDISDFYNETPKADTIYPRKTVEITKGSRLHRIIGSTQARVNSLHNQAVDKPGEGVELTAREPNGVVQGIEVPDRRFVIGIQWHPEYLPQIASQQRLFGKLVEEAGDVSES